MLLSAFPLIELKGAIPIGLKAGMNLLKVAALAYAGSTLISVPLFFLLKPIFNLLKKIKPLERLILKIEQVFYNKAEKLASNSLKKSKTEASEDQTKSKARFIIVVGVLAFVAVPFPVTGVWTGTAIAVFLGLKFKEAFPAVAIGNLIAGTIITLLTYFFSAYVDLIIYALVGVAILMLIIFIIKVAVAKPQASEDK
ncbi:MAG: small multi-drug export protein, partial [Clostridia bacterium]|nr:small multi-drug export protein [Clostridia bacterium]